MNKVCIYVKKVVLLHLISKIRNMKRIILITLYLFACYSLQADKKLSWYSINGAATHVVVTQAHHGGDFVYVGTLEGELTPVDAINNLIIQGYIVTNPSLSYDARTIFFAAKAPFKADFDLYTSSFIRGKWNAPRSLDRTINSLADELSPSLSTDGKTLYFIRKVAADPKVRNAEPKSTIFATTKDEQGKYSDPASILISIGSEYSVSILPDNTTLIFTSQRPIENSRVKVPHLYYSKRLPNNNWYDPVLIPLSEDQRFIPSSPTYNSHTNTIHYLATTTDKKPITTLHTLPEPTENFVLPLHHVQGEIHSTENNKPIEADITISDIMNNNSLSMRAHDDGFYSFALPRGGNTVIDFTAPQCSHQYLRINTQELKQDTTTIFNCNLSNQIELTLALYDGFLLEPIDATLQITDFNNTPYAHITIEKLNAARYRTVLPLGKAYRLHFNKEGYSSHTIDLAQNREIQFNSSQLDIELFPFTKSTHFEVIDAMTKERIAAEIEITNKQLPEQIILQSDTIVQIDTVLRASAQYMLNTSAKGYIYDYVTIDMRNITDNHTFVIALNPIVQGATVQLPDVNFEYNSAEIMPESLSSLQHVLQLLKINPEVSIELSAHTDDRGNDHYNLQLSQKRAASVRNYLVEKGISSDRLKAVGYGKTKPIVPNTSDENRAKNRRVEFIIL